MCAPAPHPSPLPPSPRTHVRVSGCGGGGGWRRQNLIYLYTINTISDVSPSRRPYLSVMTCLAVKRPVPRSIPSRRIVRAISISVKYAKSCQTEPL